MAKILRDIERELQDLLVSWAHIALAAAGIATMRAAVDRGDLDEAGRQGAIAGAKVVEQALVSSERKVRLAGAAAAPAVNGRIALLDALANAAAGPDRRTAIPAAYAARTIARQLACAQGGACVGGDPQDLGGDDIADDDLQRWRATWFAIALRADRWIELRTLALDVVATLAPTGIDVSRALTDDDPAFRSAAIAVTPAPVPAAMQPLLGAVIANDRDPQVALMAAQILCSDLAIDPAGPVLTALGPAGAKRLRTLVATRGASPNAVRQARRCLTAAATAK
ncbi:MAG: hypothetical protein AB7P03_00110 [Kofleriaceae bacterium]